MIVRTLTLLVYICKILDGFHVSMQLAYQCIIAQPDSFNELCSIYTDRLNYNWMSKELVLLLF